MAEGDVKDVEWQALLHDSVEQMRRFVEPFTTPISKVISQYEGEHLATGTYCEWAGRRFLVTNEHVAKERLTHPLAPKFFGSDQYFRLRRPFVSSAAPVDIAVARVDDSEWAAFPHQARAVPESHFATAHRTSEGELLFIAGYSGECARSAFNHLNTPGTPYLAQQCDLPNDSSCQPQFHFALAYNPSLATSADPRSRGLPSPLGLSGSLVWNTKRLENLKAGKLWSPRDAQVIGIVWGWFETCLVATKVEHLGLQEIFDAAESET